MNSIIQLHKKKMLYIRYLLFSAIIIILTIFSTSNLYGSISKLENTIKIDGKLKNVIKTANTTLTKTETMVIACKDITLTLPVITVADDGLELVVKNDGLCTDLITVIGNGVATIDGSIKSTLTRWKVKTYVAAGGNWIIKEKEIINENVFDVSSTGSWATIPEIVAFLKLHMMDASVIRLEGGFYDITTTQVIYLPYSLTFEGKSFGATKLTAKTGLAGKPMFRCFTDCYFKMIMFDGTTLDGYGSNPGEDAIRLAGSGTYNEIKECTFDHFSNAIVDSTNAALWLFDCDVSNAYRNGVLIHGDIPGVRVRVAQTDFMSCKNAVNMDKGSKAIVQINLGTYYNKDSTDTAIIYNPKTFSFSTMIITNNAWNSVGKLICGFDFSRPDKRDLNAYVESNAGYENEKPHSKIDVLFNTTTTIVATAGKWEKANFTGTNNYVSDFGLSGNKLTYLSNQVYEGAMNISGNIICSKDSAIFSVAVVKNGNIVNRYGETSVKVVKHDDQYQWFMNVFMEDMTKDDYYEIWITSSSNNDIYTLQDVQWYCNTQ